MAADLIQCAVTYLRIGIRIIFMRDFIQQDIIRRVVCQMVSLDIQYTIVKADISGI